MPHQTPRNLPWLDRIAAWVPGYGGYLTRGNRRAADKLWRDAVAQTLMKAKTHLEQAVRQCVERGALTEINTLDQLTRQVDRAADRLRAAGSGVDDFYNAPDLDPAKADTLHAFDHALFDLADKLVREFDAPDLDHDRLARCTADLREFEQKLDERALRLKGIR